MRAVLKIIVNILTNKVSMNDFLSVRGGLALSKFPSDPDNDRTANEVTSPDVIVYPNPAHNYITFTCLECLGDPNLKMNIQIINITGEKCIVKEIENGNSINTDFLSQGVYQVIINFGSGRIGLSKNL